jgi:hypothetical protein
MTSILAGIPTTEVSTSFYHPASLLICCIYNNNNNNGDGDGDGDGDEYTNLYPLLPAASIHL